MSDSHLQLTHELRQTLGKMELAFSTIVEAIVWTDNKGRIQWCNRAFDDLVSLPHLSVLGADLMELLPLRKKGKPLEIQEHPVIQSIKNKNRFTGEYEIAELQTLAVSAAYTEMGKEKTESVILVMRDITHRKKAEHDLLLALEKVKRTNSELKHTQSQLIQADRLSALGQLAAGVAHEINNPIGFVSSNLNTLNKYVSSLLKMEIANRKMREAILNEASSGEISDQVKQIETLEQNLKIKFISEDVASLVDESVQGLERVKKIILDLRSFARADSSEEFQLWNIHEIIESVVTIVWSEIKYKAELKKEFGEIPLIYCNNQQIGQVFINLLINSVQAIEEFGVICVRTYATADGICVEVSDTGKGISAEALPHIFDPFFTTKKVGQGTGLGLSISYDILKKHGGKISVQSEVGKGTTFKINLPKDKKS